MTIQEIYELAIELGSKADPRGVEGVKKALARAKKDYDDLPEKKKQFFDKESLKNPYADSRILFGDPKTKVKKVIVGIDITTGEVVLTDRLNEKGKKIDLIIGHHPEGQALVALDEVMDVQIDVMESLGIPVNVAESLLSERISQVRRTLGPVNHFQSVDAAKLLNIPFMVIHTIWDNMGHNYISAHLKKKDCQTVGEVLEAIEEIPEFAIAKKTNSGPKITVGSPKNRAGKVAVTGFTGGTSGSKLIYERMTHAGIGTIVEMHMGESSYEEAKKNHLNVIVSGHMASDSLGANLFLDQLEKKGVEIVPFSGLIRVKRIK
ncbi:Nif3-like dinuclear metal center hexameric protein [Patescibacteria group bacterium]|nr:Nif3-like dinuclear metal center hexameric protein [Patescibacteria group bacterium]